MFDEPPGSYVICEICGWEDDHVQLTHPTMRGGANSGSLLDHQLEILAKIPIHITEYRGFKRDVSWRPLSQRDCQVDPTAPKDGLGYFHAAVEESPIYYWQRSSETEKE